MSTGDAAQRLGLSTRQVRKLVVAGAIKEAARGVLDATSVDHYAAIDRSGTKAWAPETAWAAVALLAGLDAPWLGRDQTARLRRRLRDVTPEQLVERARDRATVVHYSAHRSVLPRIGAQIARPPREALGLAATMDGSTDGYLAAASLDRIVRDNALKEDPDGNLTLRATAVEIDAIETLVATDVLAALDLAASLDTRERYVALTYLREALARRRP
ncbi:hypothetical protein [Cellulomonas sp.]|uniref:hypothetical protein n=1 Tax=Cellulomonas sp. TaxID=40001 RepID=UPI002D694FE8|nr:hypothetical protein [Cellulomonas sp.]HYQ73552.1 hypothetical protein [Cellulomonas sp.]